ncbi:hypothetical protein GW17_00013184 [Ensete ventricosum]|nr:hypothetical protein GW17_00013184 [Ensete ventricosum]
MRTHRHVPGACELRFLRSRCSLRSLAGPITRWGPHGTRRLGQVTWAAAGNRIRFVLLLKGGRVAPTRSARHVDRGNTNRRMSPTSPKVDALQSSLIVRRDVPGKPTLPTSKKGRGASVGPGGTVRGAVASPEMPIPIPVGSYF